MEDSYDVLVVDDEESICHLLSGILEDEGYRVGSARTSGEAFLFFEKHVPKVAILDVWLERSDDGIVMLEGLRKKYPESMYLMMSGHGTIEIAVKAIKLGAKDFVTKPFRTDLLLHTLSRLMEERRLRHENWELRRMQEGNGWLMLQGDSREARRLRREVELASQTLSHVLLEGERGTGKSAIVRYLHEQRHGTVGTFVMLNYGVSEGEILFDKYFGGEEREDVYELLRGGTLVIEDVDRLSLDCQKVLLQGLLRHHKVLWGDGDMYRLMVTSRRSLKGLVEIGEFDESLYYRLAIALLQIPALRLRRADIKVLSDEMMRSRASQMGRRPRVMTEEGLSVMKGYDWYGNFHQLRNVVERLLLTGEEPLPVEGMEVQGLLLEEDHAAAREGEFPVSALFEGCLRDAKSRFEGMYLSYHLASCDGNVSRLSEVSGMERTALHRKLRTLEVKSD